MRRPASQTHSEEEKKPLKALPPDGKWGAYTAPENTIAVFKKRVGRFGTSLGHQDGIHHRVGDTIQEITWESGTVVRSTSSTGSIHLWSVPQCIHVETREPARVGRIA